MKSYLVSSLALFSLAILNPSQNASAITLDLGADYRIRTVEASSKLPSESSLSYYSQRLQLYMNTKLTRDVEADFKIQSITPWGVEGSTNPSLQTRYPSANGTPWIQTAFIRVPKIFNEPVRLTVGRQPITWGEGLVLSDDELGFNAVRIQASSPWISIPLDADAFYAKIGEGLTGPGGRDFDLFGGLLGTGSEDQRRFEIYGLEEFDGSGTPYQTAVETTTFPTTQIIRRFLGFRMKGKWKNAFYRLEYVKQYGFVGRSNLGSGDTTLQGSALSMEVGGTLRTKKIGQFDGFSDYSMGSGEPSGNGSNDSAFRPTFAHRWDGLERAGFGHYFAASLSDALNTATPYTNPSSSQTGLPAGSSGVQVLGFGAGYSPSEPWRAGVSFFTYQTKEHTTASSDSLGSEIDFEASYQFTGFLSFRGVYANFMPGDAYGPTKRNANRTNLEAQIRF